MSIKKLIFIALIVASLWIINDLVHSIYSLWQKKDLVSKARIELQHERKENDELKKRLEAVKNPGFVEEEARNKLFMARPGEGIVIIPKNAYPVTDVPKPKKDSRTNWEKWWNLFF